MLLLENNIRGGILSVMGDRHVQGAYDAKADEYTKLLNIDANNIYGWAMSQSLPTSDLKQLLFPDNYS